MKQEIAFEKNGKKIIKIFNTSKKDVFEVFRTVYGISNVAHNREGGYWVLTNESGATQIIVSNSEIEKFL